MELKRFLDFKNEILESAHRAAIHSTEVETFSCNDMMTMFYHSGNSKDPQHNHRDDVWLAILLGINDETIEEFNNSITELKQKYQNAIIEYDKLESIRENSYWALSTKSPIKRLLLDLTLVDQFFKSALLIGKINMKSQNYSSIKDFLTGGNTSPNRRNKNLEENQKFIRDYEQSQQEMVKYYEHIISNHQITPQENTSDYFKGLGFISDNEPKKQLAYTFIAESIKQNGLGNQF